MARKGRRSGAKVMTERHISSIELIFGEEIDAVSGFMQQASGLETAFMKPEGFAFTSKQHETISVSLSDSAELEPGNLCTDIPNIEIEAWKDDTKILLTWEEARILCAALWQVTNIAEFG